MAARGAAVARPRGAANAQRLNLRANEAYPCGWSPSARRGDQGGGRGAPRVKVDVSQPFYPVRSSSEHAGETRAACGLQGLGHAQGRARTSSRAFGALIAPVEAAGVPAECGGGAAVVDGAHQQSCLATPSTDPAWAPELLQGQPASLMGSERERG